MVVQRSPTLALSSAIALTLTAVDPAPSRAQARPPEPRSAGVCTLLRSSVLRFAPEAAPNPQSTIAIAATATGAIVAFRARTRDELVILRVDDNFARAGEDRVAAGPVTAFSLVSAPGGAALVMAERVARDGRDAHDDVLLARLDAAGNARNVPRSLARVARCDGVAVRPSATGFVAAWGSLDGPTTSTVTTDTRGVPNARPRVVVDASSPRMVSLTGETRFAISVSGPAGSSLLHLDETGASVEAIAQSATPVALVALPSIVLSFASSGDNVGLTRWWPAATPVEYSVALPRSIAGGARVVSSASDRSSAVLVVDDRAEREHLVRIAPDGTPVLLASFAGSNGASASALDGNTLFSATHAPSGGVELARWSCPRSTTPTTSTQPPLTALSQDGGSWTDASGSRAADSRP